MLSFQTDVSPKWGCKWKVGKVSKGREKFRKIKILKKKKSFASLLAFLLARGLALALPSASCGHRILRIKNWSHRGKHHKFVKIRVESRIRQYLIKSKAIVATGYAGATISSRALGRSPPFALRRLECFLLALLEPPATHSRQFKAQQKRKKSRMHGCMACASPVLARSLAFSKSYQLPNMVQLMWCSVKSSRKGFHDRLLIHPQAPQSLNWQDCLASSSGLG